MGLEAVGARRRAALARPRRTDVHGGGTARGGEAAEECDRGERAGSAEEAEVLHGGRRLSPALRIREPEDEGQGRCDHRGDGRGADCENLGPTRSSAAGSRLTPIAASATASTKRPAAFAQPQPANAPPPRLSGASPSQAERTIAAATKAVTNHGTPGPPFAPSLLPRRSAKPMISTTGTSMATRSSL